MDSALLGAIIGAIAGIVGTYLSIGFKFRKDLELEYDKELRNQRIRVYRSLWKLTEAFPKYERPRPITGRDLEQLQAELQTWYFRRGGLFLSDLSQPAYFAVKDALQEAIEACEPDEALDGTREKAIYQTFRTLRQALARDVATRKQLELT